MRLSSILIAALFQTTVLAVDDKEAKHNLRRGLSSSDDQGRPERRKDGKVQPRNSDSIHKITHVNLNDNDHMRIVGGTQSDVGEFPYYVDMNGCGGSLIAPDVVLSAAHCGNYQGQQVIVGAYRSGSTNNNAVRVSVQAQVMHPNYNDNTSANDFMLLKLASPVTVPGSNVVLTLNSQYSTPANGEALTVLGLGATTEGGSSATFLRDVVVQAISTNTCNQPSGYDGDVIDSNMFCAGVSGGGKDSCQGDSGGPIVKRVGNQHVQVGVVSWGEGCARASKPGVYARVSSAYNWIEGVVCDQWGSNASFCSGGGGGGGTNPNPTPAPTPPPTTGGGGGNCPSGQSYFDFTLRTDDYGYETSWEVRNSNGNKILGGSNYDSDKTYTKKQCIANNCYTLSLFDSYGDGLSEGGSNPGYTLRYAGQLVEQKGGIDFGARRNIQFGSCGGGGGGSTPTPPPTRPPTPAPTPAPTPPPTTGGGSGSCMQVVLNLRTDDWGDETDLFLLTDSGNLIWNANGFADNETYQFTTCLSSNQCATLDIFDSYGDGITSPGGITLKVDGQVQYSGGDIGGGIIFRIGGGC